MPSHEEWQILVDFAGGDKVAGKKLKAKSGWNDYEGESGNGTDEYGFSALPGGYGYDGYFLNAGDNGYWWSSTEFYASYAYLRIMLYYREGAYYNFNSKTYLFSVRCVKD